MGYGARTTIRTTRSHATAQSLAQALGWFGIGLGLIEAAAPQLLTRALGMRGREPLIAGYGAREIATGIGILASSQRAPWVWARLGGDVLDFATLALGLHRRNQKSRNVGVGLALIAGAAALDLACALWLTNTRKRVPLPDYSDRSGLREAPKRMRGAAGDFEAPRDMRTPELLRSYRS